MEIRHFFIFAFIQGHVALLTNPFIFSNRYIMMSFINKNRDKHDAESVSVLVNN